MMRAAFLCASVGLAQAHAGHGHDHGDSNIVELTSSNFDELVGQSKAVVAEFYAPWCGHCKHLKPEFEKLATTFLDSDQVMISKLNGEMFPEYSYKYNVRGFPTILWFPRGSMQPSQEYWGERSAVALMNWINTKLDDPNENPPDPDEPPPDFDLTGTWVDSEGGELALSQEGHKLTAKPLEPQHWSSAHGYIKDHEITRMPFNTVVLSGTISEDAQTIEWDNGVIWKAKAEDETSKHTAADDEPASDSNKEDSKGTESTEADTEAEEATEPETGAAADDNTATKLSQAQADAAAAKRSASNSKKKEAATQKQLMACRAQVLEFQTRLEAKDRHAAILYCVIGVLFVILIFMGCRSMASTDVAEDGDGWAKKDQASPV